MLRTDKCCRPGSSTQEPVLPEDKVSGGVERFEIIDSQIVYTYLDTKRLFDKRQQLHGKQRIHYARFEKIVVILQITDVDGIQNELPESLFDFGVLICTHYCVGLTSNKLPD